MPVDLNLAKYGDQFRAFENFASANANNMDALARIGDDGVEGALLAPDGKLDLDKYTETFEKDMSRKFKVQIANGPFVWEKGVKEARDAYVSFLTDGQVTAYADADKRTKLKACALMILTTQGFAGCAVKAVGHAFDADGNTSRIGANKQSGSNSREDSFNVAKDENGNITVECNITFPSPAISLTDARGVVNMRMTNQGSSFAYHMKVTISPESLDKFADADWEDFNSQEDKNIEPDNTRPHCCEEAAKALP